jgi:hypothetical protein
VDGDKDDKAGTRALGDDIGRISSASSTICGDLFPAEVAVFLKVLKRGFAAFDKGTTPAGKATIIVFLLLLIWVAAVTIYGLASDAYGNYKAGHLSAAEHLQIARDDCHTVSGVFNCIEPWASQAVSHLEKIPSNAPEYSEAGKLLSSIKAFRDKQKAITEKHRQEEAERRSREQAERARLAGQTEEESRAQMFKNIGGEAHDAFICNKSTDDSVIVSFDYGHYWWGDDGRCAAQIAEQQEAKLRAQQMQEEAREQAEQRKHEEEQMKRDQNAELSSYWPTTIRVDTDMDSFWLPNEERMCQTYPDGNGRVAIVACNASGSHRDHNIPVKFWGGVDRNKPSDWKCRREGDQFACRATD